MKCTHFLRVYNKRMLCEHDCVKFRGRIAWHSFLENNFAEFLNEVWVKINGSFCPVIGGISTFITATSAIGLNAHGPIKNLHHAEA